jgi:hypothetical protein
MQFGSGAGLRIVFDTSALLDLFGRWTGDYRQRRGDLVREVHVLAPLRNFLFSTQDIRGEVHQHLAIGTDLERYVTFEVVGNDEKAACSGFLAARGADFSLVALARRFESQGSLTFLITKDRTFVKDLVRSGLRAKVVPPTGFADAITVLAPDGSPAVGYAHRIQNNTYENISNSMRLARQTLGEAEYRDWQEFLNSQTGAKHDLVEALKATGVRL